MSYEIPVTIKGDATTQIRGIAATIRSRPASIAPKVMPMLCAQIPSTRSYEEFVYVSAVPKIRKWKSERVGNAILTLKQKVTVDTYEVSLAINGDDYDDDQVGAYVPTMMEMMDSLLMAPDELVTTSLVLQGHAQKGYDGVNFYATTHKWPNGKNQTAQSNLQTKSGDDAAAIETDFFTARNAMLTWLDDQNRIKNPPMDFAEDDALIVHHPVAMSQAQNRVFGLTKGGDAFDLQPNADQTKFPRKSQLGGKAIQLPDGYMDANGVTTGFWVHSCNGEDYTKPFFFLDRQKPKVTIFAQGSEHYEKNNEVLIIGKRRFGLGFARHERSQQVA